MELKQNEFNFLLNSKDEEIKLLSEEVFKINGEMDQVKRDRIRDQKLLNDYDTQNNFLSTRIKELSEKLIDGNNNANAVKERENQTFNAQMEVKNIFFICFIFRGERRRLSKASIILRRKLRMFLTYKIGQM